MRNDDDRNAECVAKFKQELVQGTRCHRVKACRWFVAKEKLRFKSDRAGKGCAFTHTARKFGWELVKSVQQVDFFESIGDDFVESRLGKLGIASTDWQGDIFGHGQIREQRTALEQNARATTNPVWNRLFRRNFFAKERKRSRKGMLEL